MSNPEPHGFPQGDQPSGANWPFLRSGQAEQGSQPIESQTQPAFPAPAAPPAQNVPQYSPQFPQVAEYPQTQRSPLPEESVVSASGSKNPQPEPVKEAGTPAETGGTPVATEFPGVGTGDSEIFTSASLNSVVVGCFNGVVFVRGNGFQRFRNVHVA